VVCGGCEEGLCTDATLGFGSSETVERATEMIVKYFDMDGNEIDPNKWENMLHIGIVRKMLEQYQQRAIEKVSQLTCPQHGGKAELTFEVTGVPDNPTIGIHAVACCDEFAQTAVEEARRSWDGS